MKLSSSNLKKLRKWDKYKNKAHISGKQNQENQRKQFWINDETDDLNDELKSIIRVIEIDPLIYKLGY